MAGKDVKAKLNYMRDEGPGRKPYFYTYPDLTEEDKARGHTTQFGGASAEVEVTIHDGRQNPELSLDKNGFQLVECETKLTTDDFYSDDGKVREVYYSEIAELMKKATGAEFVRVIHHQIRNNEKNNAKPELGTTSTVQPYAFGIHSDSHPQHAREMFPGIVAGLDPKYQKGRFLYINAWRNISDTPIVNDPLAVLDESSTVKPDDYISRDIFDKTYKLQQYGLSDTNSAQHKWYYYPDMKKNEVLLFKQWDSDTLLPGRVCFHTAFHDDSAPATPARESVECRGFAFFPNHTPNTCPDISSSDGKPSKNFPRATDPGRVTSKHLFNFHLKGHYDDHLAGILDQYKSSTDGFVKMLAAMKDNPEQFLSLVKMGQSYVEGAHSAIPLFKEAVELCSHQELKIPATDGSDHQLKINVYRPKELQGEILPAIIYANNGGGLISPVSQNKICSTLASVCQVAVFGVEYRLVKDVPFPGPVDDLYMALKHVASNSDSLSVDSEKLCLMGEQGGAHMVCSLAVLLTKRKETNLVKLLLPISPSTLDNTCFRDLSFMSQEEKTSAEVVQGLLTALAGGDLDGKAEDPLFYPGNASKEVLALFPPTVLFLAEFDKQYCRGAAFARKLNFVGRLLELVVQPGTPESQTNMAGKVFDQYMDIIKTSIQGYLIE